MEINNLASKSHHLSLKELANDPYYFSTTLTLTLGAQRSNTYLDHMPQNFESNDLGCL